MHWYAVSTKPHHEKQAELHIKQCGIECFLPLLKESKTIRRVRKTVIGPLFPGYLFARFDVMKDYRAVNYARGVRKVVKYGASPAIVDDRIVESVRSRLESGPTILQADMFHVGQVVRIERGPLEGLEAVFERKLNGPQRVVLLLQAIGYQARLVVPLQLVGNE